MAVFPTCDFPLLDDQQTIDRVRRAVANRQPLSLIRLGDGEGVVLSFGDDMWLSDLSYLHGHWGAERVSLKAVMEVKRDLETAVLGADIVGVRNDVLNVSTPEDLLSRSGSEVRDFVVSNFHVRPDEIENLSVIGARRLALLHRVLSRFDWSAQEFCNAWIHWELLATGALSEILGEIDQVGLVTSRPELGSLVARRFDLRVSTLVVPDKFVEVPSPGAHVPDRYRNVRSELNFAEGTLVLVGAGIPGKAYCEWLKESGCIAIDVGSVFDAWVGKASRPRVLESRFRIVGGDTVPLELQLHGQVSRGGRVLRPRWKSSEVPE